LQLFPSSESLSNAVTSNPNTKPVVDFINKYRSSVSTDVFESNKYSFKAFLIQVANHQSKGVLPIQFVNYDRLSDQEKEELGKFVAMVKYKEIGVVNGDKLKAGEVIKLVQENLGNPKIHRQKGSIDKFNSDTHQRCWKKYGVRPNGKSKQPQVTNKQFCVFDKPHKDYLYTRAWVDFLVEKMKDDVEYQSLYSK